MLAAEFGTLPETMRTEMRHFFDANEQWLARVLKEGKRGKVLKFTGPAVEAARELVGGLEGAMMIARSYGDPARFDAAKERILANVGA